MRSAIAACAAIAALTVVVASAPAAASTADPCRPHASPTCTSGADARVKTAAGRLVKTDAERSLRALGVPTFKSIFGRRAVRTRSRVDAALIALLTRTVRSPQARLLAGASTSGNVEAASDGIGTVLGVKQMLSKGGVRLERHVTIESDSDACPTQTSPQNTHANVTIRVAGSYELTARYRVRGWSVTRSILIIMPPVKTTGAVDQNARFDFLWPHAASVRVAESGEARGHHRTRRYSKHVDLEADPSGASWSVALEGKTWNQYIQKAEADVLGEPPPPPYHGPLLSSRTEQAYVDLVRAFLQMVDAHMVRALTMAERKWQTPNACARIEWSPASDTLTLASGSVQEVTGRIRPLAAGLDGAQYHWPDPRTTIGTVTRTTAGSIDGQPIRLSATAGDPQGGHTVRATFRVPSTIGVVSGEWLARAADNDLYYRVVAAAGNDRADGTLTTSNSCVINATVDGPWTFAFTQTTGPPDGELHADQFGLSGSVVASGTTTVPAQTIGCNGSSTILPSFTSTGHVGPFLTFDPVAGQAGMVDVTWYELFPPLILGTVEVLGPDCRADETDPGSGFHDTVPLATLQQKTPFTLTHDTPFTVDRGPVDLRSQCTGNYHASLTLQRVNADGSPL